MVSDVMKRITRLDLSREIIRTELRLAGADHRFSSVEINQAARVYLTITRHNTTRLATKLRVLNAQLEQKA